MAGERVAPIAASTGGLSANVNLSDLVDKFLGKTSTSSDTSSSTTQNSGSVANTGTTTTDSSISSDAMAAMLKSILEGTSGLASTALGEHAAGLYNSSTNQLLTNDLLTRAAAQVAQNTRSQTVTQNTQQTDTRGSTTAGTTAKTTIQNPQIAPASAGKAALAIGAMSLVPKDIRDSIVSGIKNKFNIGTSAAPSQADMDAGAQVGANNAISDSNYSGADFGTTAPVTADIPTGNGAFLGDTADAVDAGSTVSDAASGIPDGYASISDALDSGEYALADAGDAGGDILSSIGDFFSADGGEIRDPNNLQNPVSTNLDLSQHNPVTLATQAVLAHLSRAAGYADGGLAQRRTAAMDAAEVAAVNGNDANGAYQQALAPAKPASAPAPTPQVQPNALDNFVRGAIKSIRGYKNGGMLHYDDGGKVDLTNLGLTIQAPKATSGNPGLAAINSPSDTSTATATIGNTTDQGTGFANTSNLVASTPAAAAPRLIKLPPNISNPVAGDSSTTSGQAVGGIDSSPQSVQNAAVSLGLAMTPLAVLSPVINAILGKTIGTVGTVADNSPSTTTATAAADTAAPDAVGSVSVGSIGVSDSAPDTGTIGAVSDAEGMSAEGPGIGDAGSGTSDGDSTSTADSGNGVGDGGDSASAGDSGGVGGDAMAKGGNVTGPGDETSDSIPVHLSDGEFVVNAEATSRFRPLLEMINNAFKAR